MLRWAMGVDEFIQTVKITSDKVMGLLELSQEYFLIDRLQALRVIFFPKLIVCSNCVL